jgi:polyphosphate kinase
VCAVDEVTEVAGTGNGSHGPDAGEQPEGAAAERSAAKAARETGPAHPHAPTGPEAPADETGDEAAGAGRGRAPRRRSAAVVTEPEGDEALLVEAHGPDRFINREVSWLDFAERLLDIADDPSLPVLERVKFLAIFSSGLDEFLQVRVAGLKDQVDASLRTRSPDGRTASDQLAEVRAKLAGILQREERVYNDGVWPRLSKSGIEILAWEALDGEARKELLGVFERDIFPVLTPLAVDPGHPFPYISNLSLNLAVIVVDPERDSQRFARVKVPPLLPRFVPLSDGVRFVPLEQVIAPNLGMLFPDMQIGSYFAFRVIRNADLALEESEADDLLAAVEVELRRRRFGRAVALQVESGMPVQLREMLSAELELGADDVYESAVPLDLGALFAISAIERPELREPSWAPMTQPRLATASDDPVDLFASLRERDVLVHHPYDSFATSVEAFIDQAASDTQVLAIKQTLYRTSGDTPIVSALIRAAEAGKQVVVLVELKARFEEQANIAWARALEQAGCHVVYGLVGLKTHAKIALVVRREEEGIRRYCHIGTGNYNSETARAYEDLGILTADPDVGADLTDLFNYLTGYSRPSKHRKIVVAPYQLREWILEQIAAEAAAGTAGRITIKVNGLTDPGVIDALYRASQAGTRIELIVRGLCCLRPGVPGLSDTISVRSIVGRFLEHSRIYRFGNPRAATSWDDDSDSPRAARYYLGSADLMDRNLDRRVEALVPVTDLELCERLEAVLALNLADDTSAWLLDADGAWHRALRRVGVSTQGRLADLARERARRRRAPDPSVGGTAPIRLR